MKQIALTLLFTTMMISVFCQINERSSFEQELAGISKKGMLVLGGWGAVNIIGGAIGTRTHNPEVRYFHQMNVIWGSTNLLIASLGYLSAKKKNTSGLSLSSVLANQHKMEKTFLLNAGLDLAYITTGLYLSERSRRNADPSKLKGYGNSTMFQGGFLLLFDALMYSLHSRHGKMLTKFTDKVTVLGGPGSLALIYML